MKKKSLKSTKQLYFLSLYFKEKPDQWPKKQVVALGKQIGLSRSQVYKWLWDQRNQARAYEKQQSFIPHYEGFGQKETNNFLQNLKKRAIKKYHSISYRNRQQEIILTLPDKIDFCQEFNSSKKSSYWCNSLLNKYGCQLIRLKSDDSLLLSEKKQKIPRISQFREVKEEYVSSKK